jgi:hypothetical protein
MNEVLKKILELCERHLEQSKERFLIGVDDVDPNGFSNGFNRGLEAAFTIIKEDIEGIISSSNEKD